MNDLERVLEFIQFNNYCTDKLLTTVKEYKTGEMRNLLPYIPISKCKDFPVPNFKQIQKEIKSLDDYFISHRNYGGHKNWSSICLYGLSSVHIGSHEKAGYEEFNKLLHWTDVSYFTPTIVNYIKQLKYKRLSRVRIMKLGEQGYIAPHQDVDKPSVGGALNISISNPDKCKFYVEDNGYLPFDKYFAIHPNIGYNHCVYNETHENRYHLIVHGDQGREMENWKEEALKGYLE